MRTALFSTLIMALAIGVAQTAKAELNVLGFQAWKTSRVEEAKSALDKIQNEGSEKKAEVTKPTPGRVLPKEDASSRGGRAGRPDQRLQQAQLNVEIAQELSVNDYFILYLNQFKEKEALLEAAKKLTPEEVADLMSAYQKQLSRSAQADVPVAPGLLSGVGSAKAGATGL